MSRIERLVNLTAALLASERPLTAEELRSRVPGYPEEKALFRRQFERDKEVLRELGVPLTTVSLPADATESSVAYRIPQDDYYLRDPGLDPDELSALHLAARVVQLDGLVGGDAAWKLGGGPDRDASVRDGAGLAAMLPASDALAALFAAIAAGSAVTFRYRDEERTVQPVRLTFRAGHWYLAGHDAGRGADRSFRVDRIGAPIVQIAAVADAPQRTSGSGPAFGRPWEIGDGDAVEAMLRIDAAQAPWVVSHLGADAVVRRDADGACIVRLAVRNDDALRSFVLGFLDHAELLSPAEMRAGLVGWLSKIAGSIAAPIAGDPEAAA